MRPLDRHNGINNYGKTLEEVPANFLDNNHGTTLLFLDFVLGLSLSSPVCPSNR